MIRTIARVARGEGLASVAARSVERIGEAWRLRRQLSRGAAVEMPHSPLVNVLTTAPSPRLGGVSVQLKARLAEERKLREVALFHPGLLEVGSRAWRTESLASLGARTLVLEGAFDGLPPLPDDIALILVIHDFTLLDNVSLLNRARAAIFPSAFLRDAHLAVAPDLEAHVIEPGIGESMQRVEPRRERIAFAGSVKPLKGGALLPEIIRATPGAEWHIFGGGDVELLQPLSHANTHGYYRAGSLPRLLARHHIGLVILPSIVPESFSLVLSECWSAGVPVVAFDHGAIAERIRSHGGGFLVPLEAGAEGIASMVNEWLRGAIVDVPRRVPTASESAAAHVLLYRSLGVL
jgi:glycosyltransferase involved in cell wall biosynthesis